MNKIDELLSKVMDILKEQYGEDFVIEDGDEFVFELNDCIFILEYTDRNISYKFIGNKPFKVDFTTGFYKGEEE